MLHEIENFRLGQTLDEVRSSAQILSGIARPSQKIDAIVVKFIILSSLIPQAMKEDPDEAERRMQNVDLNDLAEDRQE